MKVRGKISATGKENLEKSAKKKKQILKAERKKQVLKVKRKVDKERESKLEQEKFKK
jgi:hypothetical protein